jgi:hypothetical protein
MSNPLLKPNDPRFQQAEIRDAAGKNPYAESAQPQAESSTAAEIYAASTGDEARPFVPKYEVQQQSRPGLLFVLGAMGWAAAAIGAVSLTGLFDIGWICPLLGVIPGGAAWLLAHEELKQIAAGLIAAQARATAQHAYWIGLTALIMCAMMVAAMIYQSMNFWPDL